MDKRTKEILDYLQQEIQRYDQQAHDEREAHHDLGAWIAQALADDLIRISTEIENRWLYKTES